MSGHRYELRVLLPHQDSGSRFYVDTDGFWNTVDSSDDIDYLREQRDIMLKFWRRVQIVALERVVLKETVVE